jgi:folate-binding protein YgfZ
MNTDSAVVDSAAAIDDAARDRVTVSGSDALTYLQSQIAQEIRDLGVGAARWTMVLEPTGKIVSLARIRRTADDTFVLDTDAGFGASLLARLERFKIRVAVETALEPAANDEPSGRHEAERIALGWPRMGYEIEPGSTIPATTSVLAYAVNFQKGCYPGQELVERMDSRDAEAPRALRILDLDPDAAPGDAVFEGDSEVGVVTSVAGSIGLGYVKRGSPVGRPPTHLTL